MLYKIYISYFVKRLPTNIKIPTNNIYYLIPTTKDSDVSLYSIFLMGNKQEFIELVLYDNDRIYDIETCNLFLYKDNKLINIVESGYYYNKDYLINIKENCIVDKMCFNIKNIDKTFLVSDNNSEEMITNVPLNINSNLITIENNSDIVVQSKNFFEGNSSTNNSSVELYFNFLSFLFNFSFSIFKL